jgi:hypothetical protein
MYRQDLNYTEKKVPVHRKVKLPSRSSIKVSDRDTSPIQQAKDEIAKILGEQKNYQRFVSVYNQDTEDLKRLIKPKKPKPVTYNPQSRYGRGDINDSYLPFIYSKVKAPRIGYNYEYHNVLDVQNRDMIK